MEKKKRKHKNKNYSIPSDLYAGHSITKYRSFSQTLNWLDKSNHTQKQQAPPQSKHSKMVQIEWLSFSVKIWEPWNFTLQVYHQNILWEGSSLHWY